MEPDKIQGLKEQTESELLKIMNHSTLGKVAQEYCKSASGAITVELKLGTTELQPKLDAASRGQEAKKVCLKLVRPCPDNGDPEGCWQRC